MSSTYFGGRKIIFILRYNSVMANLKTQQDYRELLLEIRQRVNENQAKAVLAVNKQLLTLYREIGNLIIRRQEKAKWGDKVLGKLAKDIKSHFPEMKGFSRTNLKYMKMLAAAYPSFEIGQVPLDQITRYHHITLLTKCKNEEQRIFYASKAIEHGWSRNVMMHQIESNLFDRQGGKVSNFDRTLSEVQAVMAWKTMKDPYVFDFLNLSEKVRERELESELIKHIKDFLLELGEGFAYVGRQYPIEVAGQDFYLDLLFYHLKLHCYVVIDLKIGEFKPEYAGKMNFYLTALDRDLKTEYEQPSIGIILCKSKNKVVAEYSLEDMNKAMGVAEYRLLHSIDHLVEALENADD